MYAVTPLNRTKKKQLCDRQMKKERRHSNQTHCRKKSNTRSRVKCVCFCDSSIAESKQKKNPGENDNFYWFFGLPLISINVCYLASVHFFHFSLDWTLATVVSYRWQKAKKPSLSSHEYLMFVCFQCWWYTYIDLIVVISYYIALTSSTIFLVLFVEMPQSNMAYRTKLTHALNRI